MFPKILKYKVLVIIFVCFYNVIKGQEQILFTITQIPEYTPIDDTIYLAGTLNNWTLSDQNHKFRRLPDGSYRLAITLKHKDDFEFKINRGNWESVEGNNAGDYLPNHEFTYSDSIYEYNLTVRSWQDLHKQYFPAIKITALSIPKNTPKGAKLFVCGTFNEWNSRDPDYELKKTSGGIYVVEIKSGQEKFHYKFTRGSWKSVESRWDMV